MKKLLLTLAAAGAIVTASAAVTDLTKVWSASAENSYKAEAKEWNAPVAVDAEGNMIATGAFTEDFTIAGANLEAIGSSAYVVKYDKTGKAAWAVAFTGAATITAIDTDADGNIYIAGTLADEVTFGTTSGTAIVKEGMKVDGTPTVSQCASFLAKYDKDGKIITAESFAPEYLPALVETGGYFGPLDDYDVFFHINKIAVNGNDVYASALFTGKTTIGDTSFEGSYNDPWFGALYFEIKSAAVFKLDATFKTCDKLIECVIPEPLATDNSYSPTGISFALDNSTLYAVFSGSGPLTVKNATSTKNVEATFQDYNFIFVSVNDNKIDQFVTFEAPDAGFDTSCNPTNSFVYGSNIFVTGYEAFAENYNTADERIGNEIFVFTAATNNLAGAQKKVFESISGDITYYDVESAAILSTGEIYINTLGRYNNTKTEKVMEGEKEVTKTIFSKGDFANVAKSFVFANDAFAPASTVTDAVGVAAAGSYVAFSQIGETGAIFSLYNDTKSSGISDIVADENAEAEYFNLQGVRVANPENGLYIVRRGNKVTKEIIR